MDVEAAGDGMEPDAVAGLREGEFIHAGNDAAGGFVGAFAEFADVDVEVALGADGLGVEGESPGAGPQLLRLGDGGLPEAGALGERGARAI